MPPALWEQVAALSRDEKAELLVALQDELDNEPIPDELKAELDRRRAESDADPSGLLDIDETMAELRAKYGR